MIKRPACNRACMRTRLSVVCEYCVHDLTSESMTEYSVVHCLGSLFGILCMGTVHGLLLKKKSTKMTPGNLGRHRTESLVYKPRGLGFNDCLITLNHLELYRFPLSHLNFLKQSQCQLTQWSNR